jgi:hypothetical protein
MLINVKNRSVAKLESPESSEVKENRIMLQNPPNPAAERVYRGIIGVSSSSGYRWCVSVLV